MRWRLHLLLFIAYLALDLGSPFIPGAFVFNADQCVELAHGERQRDAARAERRADGALDAAPQTTTPPATALRTRVPHVLTEWFVSVRLAHAASPPSASAEEH
jgi:hypothetical protein